MLPPAPSHRILIVTDAWKPQVNGVVRTLTTVVQELQAMGHVVDVIGPDRFRTFPCPTYPDIALSLLPRRRSDPHDRGVQPRRPAHRDRRAAWSGGAKLGEADGVRLHHRIPHPVRRICAGPDRASGAADLCLDATLPRRRPGHDGRDPVVARRTDGARVSATSGPGRGASISICSSPTRRPSSHICRGRSSSMSAGWRWRRTSARSLIWTCRDRRLSSAAVRNWRRCSGSIRR